LAIAQPKTKRGETSRAVILQAALDLFQQRGYDATTIADIAGAVEVAPRTVTLYFPSKADLALTFANALEERLAAAFAARAPGEQALDVLSRWLLDEGRMLDRERAALTRARVAAHPGLPGLTSAPHSTDVRPHFLGLSQAAIALHCLNEAL